MSKFKLGQYFNIDGIIFGLKWLFKIRKIKPDMHVKIFDEICLENLDKNIKYIVFDKDNTITIPHEFEISIEIKQKLNEFQRFYGVENLAIISNSAGSNDDKGYMESDQIEELTGIQVVKHKYKKPRVNDEILRTFPGSENHEICVIGDRLLVDVLMGKEYGYYTILVDPLTLTKDNIIVRFMRTIEKIILNRL
jgi:phosphatidylglycerophosphatase GEP4